MWQGMAETLEALPHDSGNFGIIHNDLHIGNLMLIDPNWEDEDRGTGLIVWDFDVSARHWFVTDLAIAAFVHPLWQMRQRHPEEMASFVADFVAAYSEIPVGSGVAGTAAPVYAISNGVDRPRDIS